MWDKQKVGQLVSRLAWALFLRIYEEYRYTRPDGEIRWLWSQAFPIQNAAGTVIRVVGTFEDITDVKQREATERALKQIVQQHHGQIWVESSLAKGSTFYFALPSIVEDATC